MAPETRLSADVALWLAAVLTIWTGWNYWQGAWQTMTAKPDTRETE